MQVFFSASRGIYVLTTAPLEYTNTKNRLKFRFVEVDFLMNPPYLKVAPPEGEMPKIEGQFWVLLVFVYSKGAVVRT